jgi:hypothetical protein
MTRHPNESTLVTWLETDKPSRVGRHVEHCDECLARVDELSGLDPATLSGLSAASAPPTDLQERATGATQGRLATEEAAAAFVELFALPWRTLAVMVDPGHSREPGRQTGVDPAVTSNDDSDDDGERTHG